MVGGLAAGKMGVCEATLCAGIVGLFMDVVKIQIGYLMLGLC